MEAIHVSDWKSAILIISAGARKRPFPDFSGAPPQQPPANRSGFVRKGNNLCGRRRCAGRGHASLSERRLWQMTLRCPKASRTQSIAALFLRSGLTPSAEAKIATASKKTEGAPDSAISVAKCFPDLRRTPPKTIASSAPSRSSASRKACRRSPSAPSVTSAPIFRPFSIGLALPTRVSAGERSIGA